MGCQGGQWVLEDARVCGYQPGGIEYCDEAILATRMHSLVLSRHDMLNVGARPCMTVPRCGKWVAKGREGIGDLLGAKEVGSRRVLLVIKV